MRTLIVLVVGLLAAGCSKSLTEEEKQVVGEYELKKDGNTIKDVFLDNGVIEWYNIDGSKTGESKWSIVDGEIHVKSDSGGINIFRINTDKSITPIASISDGKRTDYLKEKQWTFKKSNNYIT